MEPAVALVSAAMATPPYIQKSNHVRLCRLVKPWLPFGCQHDRVMNTYVEYDTTDGRSRLGVARLVRGIGIGF